MKTYIQFDIPQKSKMSFLDFFLPLYGILAYYPFPIVSTVGMGIMYIYTIIRFIRCVILQKKTILIDRTMLLFLIYALISQPVVYLIFGGFNQERFFNILTIPMIIIVVFLNYNQIHIELFYKWFFYIGAICSILMIIQAIELYIWGRLVYPIRILPFDTSEWFNKGTRPTGFFPEPQAYATYILPLLYLSLKVSDIWKAIFISISIICSTSSLGIIGAIVCWVVYIFSIRNKNWNKVMSIILIGIAIFVLSSTKIYEFALNKILKINIMNDSRLSHGFDIVNKLRFQEIIFGIGKNNIRYYIDSGKITLFDSISIAMRNAAYVTSAADILIGFGIIGSTIYLYYFAKQLRYYSDRGLLLLLIILTFAQTIFLNSPWVEYMLIYYSLISLINLNKKDYIFIKLSR